MEKHSKERKVSDFRLDLIDHLSHKQLWSLRFTRLTAISALVTAVIIIIILFFLLFAYTPLRHTIPGYPSQKTRKEAIQTAIRVDSLERIITRWELYSENVRRVIDGKTPLNIDSLIHEAERRVPLSKEELARQDSLLRMQVLAEEQFELSNKAQRILQIEGVHFFSPLKGVISQGYDIIHPYIDITAPENSVVNAVLDGTVIFDGWTEEAGYTIQIQHSGDIISIYKHSSKLLKKTGDKVSAGTPIALVGGTGSLSTGEHLHFELWYKGEAVDPTKYISF